MLSYRLTGEDISEDSRVSQTASETPGVINRLLQSSTIPPLRPTATLQKRAGPLRGCSSCEGGQLKSCNSVLQS